MKKLFSLLIIVFLLVGCSSAKYETIDSNYAMKLISDGAYIIDVRTEDEYNTGHIINSVNIPLDIIDTIDYNLDDIIIVYCSTGIRSEEASKKLISMGYNKVYNLDGGLINWGFELEE